jgi:homocysteine S-methyltransferase
LGVPAWLSVTCADGRTRAGEAVDGVFAMAADVREVLAVGVNCCDASEVSALLSQASVASGKPGVAYPNSGEGWDAINRKWTGRSTFDPDVVDEWVTVGARLIGGCCRVTPAEIGVVAGELTLHR